MRKNVELQEFKQVEKIEFCPQSKQLFLEFDIPGTNDSV